MIELTHPSLSIRQQCSLVDFARSSYYNEHASESEEILRYLRLLDEQYIRKPFYGSRKMTPSCIRKAF